MDRRERDLNQERTNHCTHEQTSFSYSTWIGEVGRLEGDAVGALVEGRDVGSWVGSLEGWEEGCFVGMDEGWLEG